MKKTHISENSSVNNEIDQFLKHSADMLCVLSFEGEFMNVNPALENGLGYKSRHFEGKPLSDVVHKDDRERVSGEINALNTGRELRVFTARLARNDGGYISLLWRAIGNPEKRRIYTHVVSSDAESFRPVSADLFFRIIESIPEGFVIYDNNGLLVSCNRAFRDLYGYSEKEAAPGVHYRILGILDVERGRIAKSSIERTAYIGRRDHLDNEPVREFTMELADGRRIQSRDRLTPDGYIISVQSDVTDWAVSEERLRASTKSALDQMNFGTICLDMDGKVMIMNDRAREIMDDDDGLYLGADGKCYAEKPTENDRLQNLVLDLVTFSPHDPDANSGGALSVSKKSGDRPYSLLVTAPVNVPYDLDRNIHAGVIFVSDPQYKVQASADVIGSMYGLTPSESRLASGLVAGKTLKETAQGVNITEGTARVYLKSVFAKTFTRSQADLVRLVLSGPASLWWR